MQIVIWDKELKLSFEELTSVMNKVLSDLNDDRFEGEITE